MEPRLRADRAELVRDERFDLVPMDDEKLGRYRQLREDESFDLVVGNPPYVTEANNKPLFDRLRAISAWKGIYRGKTDYLYYFLWLAVEKLRVGGRLCVITPAGWMNAGNAAFLREKLASELRLDEIFLFGSYRLFAADQGPAPTPLVESAILVATKEQVPDGHLVRVVALEDESQGGSLGRGALLDEMARRAAGVAGRRSGIHVHDVPQSELAPDRPWPIKVGAEDLAARVVKHLQRLLDEDSISVEPLAMSWKMFMGIETGADAYTARVRKRLAPDIRARLEAAGATPGDPILQLPPGSETKEPWVDHPEVLARAPEARALLYGAVDDADYTNYVRIERHHDVPEPVLERLEPWRPVLAGRAEIYRNQARKWWETAWPRKAAELAAPKVMGVHRTDRGRFAVDQMGEWQPGKAVVVVVAREQNGPVEYLCGILNAELLDLWYAVRGRTPRDVWRDYEPKPMAKIPYRRPEGDPRADRVADLVREIASNRRTLLPHRTVVHDLQRIVKDPWKAGPVVIDRAALIDELEPRETVSVRLDPELESTIRERATGRILRESQQALIVVRGKREIARVTGNRGRLDLLEELLGGVGPADLDSTLLPHDLDEFENYVRARERLVNDLLAEGRRLVEMVERLVCAMYDVPDELTEEVVDHAIRRAAAAA